MVKTEKLEKAYNEATVKRINALNNRINLIRKLSPLNVQSKYITCRECGSKLSVEHMKRLEAGGLRLACPVCGSKTALYSATANSRLEAADKRHDDAAKKVLECKKALEKVEMKSQSKKPSLSAQEKGIREVESRLEVIYATNSTPDFVEIQGEIGGDLLCYRVYNDGSIYEK